MSRSLNLTRHYMRCASVLDAWSAGEASEEDVVQMLALARSESSSEDNQAIDGLLVQRLGQTRDGLQEASEMITAAEALLDKYGSAPLIPAIFLGVEHLRLGDMAIVANGSGRRTVALAKEIDAGSLRRGDWVYLSSDQSVLFSVAKLSNHQVGEVGTFDSYASDGRMIIKSGANEQLVVQAADSLSEIKFRPGDTLLWDRQARLCFEKMDSASNNPYLLEEIEDLPLESVGGQATNWDLLTTTLLNSLLYPELAQEFKLQCSNTILLYGPPGTGKTYLTKAACAEIQRISGRKVRFALVKASQWESPFVGVTQQNIAALFADLRLAAEEGSIVVLFVDEIDACGRIRGSLTGHHSDKALAAFLNELSGFKALPNVSVVAASNRIDLLDGALLSRFATHIPIRRPDIQAAQEIFDVHLDKELPYANEHTRDEMIALGVSRLFAPNAIGSDVCVLKLRDGRTRTVAARELVSARLISQITDSAKRQALKRCQQTGIKKLVPADMDIALAEARNQMCEALSPHNAHNQLESLAADEVVLAVEPIRSKSARSLRFVNAA